MENTIYYHADFVPMTGENDTFEALATSSDGRILATGTLAEVEAAAGPDAQKIDLQGACMMPGFIDPHSHFTGCIQYATTADLSACTSFDEIKQACIDFMNSHNVGEDGIVMGVGYDQNQLKEGRHPDKFLLDEVSKDIPVLITHVSSHMGVGNSKLLELAGLDENTPDPEGGRFGRVGDTQELNGYAEEPAALFQLNEVSNKRMNMDIPSMLPEMQDVYLQNGITTCQDGATQPAFADLFCAMAQQNRFKLDLVGYPMYGQDVDGMLSKHEDFVGQDYVGHFRIGGIKMFADGSPQARTAWMSQPYEPTDEDPRTDFCSQGTMTDEEALEFAQKAVDRDLQLLCHCNGDAASDQYLRVYEQALKNTTNSHAQSLRPVMIHCQTARRDQYEKMAELGMTPSIFVTHTYYWGDIHLKNFGKARGMRVSAVHDALECGLHYTFHSDTPVLRPNQLENVWCAVNRLTKNGVQLDESQKVTPYEALCGVTINAAWQYGEEKRKGTLEAGKLADLVILDKNPLKVDPMEIRDIKVQKTIKESKVVWEA